MDYPDERANGHHVMLDSQELVTVRADQANGLGGVTALGVKLQQFLSTIDCLAHS